MHKNIVFSPLYTIQRISFVLFWLFMHCQMPERFENRQCVKTVI